MKRTKLIIPLLVMTGTVLVEAQPMLTNNIFIINWDFETAPVPNTTVQGWTEQGGVAAHYQVVTNPPVAEGAAYCAFRGLNTAQNNGGINQTSTDTWKPGTYTVQVAGSSIGPNGKGFNVKLYANTKNNNLMNELFDIPAPFGATNWITNQFSVTVANDHPQLGGNVGIHFSPRTDQGGTADVLSALDMVNLVHVGSVGLYGYGQNYGPVPSVTNQYALGDSVSLGPLYQGTPTSFSIDPPLPGGSGLTFDTFGGGISGFAATQLPASAYEITAVFAEGWTNSTIIVIEVVTPALVDYSPNTASGVVNQDFLTLNPVLVGTGLAFPTNFFASPPLPAGLTLESFGGGISGTPTAIGSNTYNVVAQYASYASSTAAVSIVVLPPSLVRYADNDFKVSVGAALRSPGLPTLSGVDLPTGYAVTPPLPEGFDLNPATGELTGTGAVASATSLHTITASYAGFPDSTVDIAIEVTDDFADDFNFAGGALGGDPNWTAQIPAGFSLDGQVASAPGGNSGFVGPTTTYDRVTNAPGQDFTLSTDILFGGGHRAGLVFGFQDTNNFWMCMLNNGRETTAGLNTDFTLRYRQDGTNDVTVVNANSGPNVPLNQTYTMTVQYDDDTQTLAILILDPTNGVFYSGSYVLATNDLPVATNTVFGIQAWSAGNVTFNNFRGNFDEVVLGPVGPLQISGFSYDPITGDAVITWPGSAAKSYNLFGGSDVSSLGLLQSGIPGVDGDITVTNSQPVATPAHYYQVEQY